MGNRHSGYVRSLLFAAVLLQSATAQDEFQVLLQFPATDQRVEHSLPLSRDVVLNVRRATDVHGLHMGWDLSAVDRRLKESPNFLLRMPVRPWPASARLLRLAFRGQPLSARATPARLRVSAGSARALLPDSRRRRHRRALRKRND